MSYTSSAFYQELSGYSTQNFVKQRELKDRTRYSGYLDAQQRMALLTSGR